MGFVPCGPLLGEGKGAKSWESLQRAWGPGMVCGQGTFHSSFPLIKFRVSKMN